MENRITINNCILIELPRIQNRAGNITPIEGLKNIPFTIKRVFYLYDIPGGENRGAHGHKKCHQLIIAASGSFKVIVDDGIRRKKVNLNRPYFGLYIPPGIWAHEVNFSSGSICLVLTSHKYDENDYLRSYEDYKKYVING